MAHGFSWRVVNAAFQWGIPLRHCEMHAGVMFSFCFNCYWLATLGKIVFICSTYQTLFKSLYGTRKNLLKVYNSLRTYTRPNWKFYDSENGWCRMNKTQLIFADIIMMSFYCNIYQRIFFLNKWASRCQNLQCRKVASRLCFGGANNGIFIKPSFFLQIFYFILVFNQQSKIYKIITMRVIEI